MKDVIGKKVYGNWGAYIPTGYGEVIGINPKENTVIVRWEVLPDDDPNYDPYEFVNYKDVKNARPESGSKIGLYWNEMDAY